LTHSADAIGFRPVTETDLSLLHGWLNRPHLRQFYQKRPITLDEVAAEYAPAIRGEEQGHLHLALQAGRPFGYLQCYRNLEYPDYARELDLRDGASIDFYIGEPDALGRGLGKHMERSYVLDVVFPLYPAESNCYVCHESSNGLALACSQAAGFKPLRDVIEAGLPSHVLVFARSVPRSSI
jgi:aminoglycoside 6'-N-acetyltransferase